MSDRRSAFAAAALGLFFAGFMLATTLQQRQLPVFLALAAVAGLLVVGVMRMLWDAGHHAGRREGFDHALLLWKEQGNLDAAWAAKQDRDREKSS